MMSNPAVFELAQSIIANQKICIEDNIGESIHLHIGLVRIDMTVKEFQNLASTLQKVLNCVTSEFFDVSKYDAYFLERIAVEIPYILSVEKHFLKLSEIKFCYEIDINGKFLTCNINESPVFKYYGGEEIDLEQFENRGDIFQSNRERADKVFMEIKNNTAKNIKICVDSQNRILDGYLTAAALMRLYGDNKQIEIERFRFENTCDSIAVRRLKKKLW